jgi:hypothetical protein
MVMLSDFNQKIIPDYSPISSKGGGRRRSSKFSRKLRTRKYKKSKRRHSRRQ